MAGEGSVPFRLDDWTPVPSFSKSLSGAIDGAFFGSKQRTFGMYRIDVIQISAGDDSTMVGASSAVNN
jgi:hypothetical protein